MNPLLIDRPGRYVGLEHWPVEWPGGERDLAIKMLKTWDKAVSEFTKTGREFGYRYYDWLVASQKCGFKRLASPANVARGL